MLFLTKSVFDVSKEYAEFQYRRRHRQRRRGDMSSLRSNTPDPDDSSDSILGTAGRKDRHIPQGVCMVQSVMI